MESFSLERVIAVGDRKLTDMYRSSRDLGISKEVVLKGFLRKARDISELQKQTPLHPTHSKCYNDNCTYGNILTRSPMENIPGMNAYNNIMINMMNTYMYSVTPTLESETLSYSNTTNTSTNNNDTSVQGYPAVTWSLETSGDLSFNSAPIFDGFIPDLYTTLASQTATDSNSLNYSFEQSSYYNYLSVPLSMANDSSTNAYSTNEYASHSDAENNSCENTPPFYSELSKALLLNESPEAQSSANVDKRKRCYEEADIEAQIHQAKKLATV